MKITIVEGTSEEIAKILPAICGSKEQNDNNANNPFRPITVQEKFDNWDLYKDEYEISMH